jgi:hypothetical protein
MMNRTLAKPLPKNTRVKAPQPVVVAPVIVPQPIAAAPSTARVNRARGAKPNLFTQTSEAVRRLTVRAEVLHRRVARWHLPNAQGEGDLFATVELDLADVVACLKAVSDGLGHIPADWRPPMGGARMATLRVGESVVVRLTVRAGYADVLEAHEMEGLTVETVGAKGKVVCRTAAGDRVVFPTAHLAHV